MALAAVSLIVFRLTRPSCCKMRWLSLNLVILCLFALQCAADVNGMSSDAVAMAETESSMDQLVMETIETANQALSLYDKLIERIIPWKEFNNTLAQLDIFKQFYSVECAALIGEIKTHMLNGMDAYFAASQSIYEFAGQAASHLSLYISLLNDQNDRQAAAQKELLIELLDSGAQKMTAAQNELGKSSSSFNSVFGRLMALRSRFEHESDDKIADYKKDIKAIRGGSYLFGILFGGIEGLIVARIYGESRYVYGIKMKLESFKRFYDNLKVKIEQALHNIDDTKTILKTEIQHISNLKIQSEQTEVFVDMDNVSALRDTVIDSAQELIAKCMEYRQRHIEKTELI